VVVFASAALGVPPDALEFHVAAAISVGAEPIRR
jgi:hypothetical protein